MDASAVAASIDRHQWGALPARMRGGWTGDVWLGAVLVPERQDAPYIDELKLGSPELHDQVLGLALVGRGAVFRPSRRTDVNEELDHLVFEQHDDRARSFVAALEVHTDGTLVYRTAVERRTSTATSSLADSHVIDEDAVRRAIAAFIAFANSFYKRRRRDTGNLYLGMSLADIEYKHFGRLPNQELRTFSFADHRLNDPLRIPATPLRITPAQQANPEGIAKTAVEHIARVFRVAGAYYTPPA